MDCVEWDGRQLGSEPLALTLMTSVEGPASGGVPRVLLAAVAAGAHGYLVRPGRLGELLCVHRDGRMACYEVGPFHEAVREHLLREGEQTALEVLRAFVTDHRLDDVGILDQLIGMGQDGLDRPRRSLDVLAYEYNKSDISKELMPLMLSGTPAESWEAIDQLVKEAALAIAAVTLAIHRAAMDRVGPIAANAGVDPDHIDDWGPLSLGVQVQGVIALHRVGRRGLVLRRAVRDEIRTHAEARFLECSRELYRDPDARRCFGWKTKGDAAKVKLDASGRPVFVGPVLEKWLSKTLSSTLGWHSVPLRPPSTDVAQISVYPGLWGDLARIHPLLRAWADLDSAADVMACLADPLGEGHHPVRPQYEILPGIRSIGPDLERLRRLIPISMLEAPLGRALLVGELRDLELRCLAEVCEATGNGSKLAGLFRDGVDPIEYAAAAFYSDDMYLHDHPRWKEGLEELRERDPARHESWRYLARTFVLGAARGLSHEHLVRLLDERLGVDIKRSCVANAHRLIAPIFPDLSPYLRDPTADFVCAALKVNVIDAALFSIAGGTNHDKFAIQLRDAVAGRREDPDLFARLLELTTDPVWRGRLAKGRGSRDFYDEIFLQTVPSGTGMIRAGMESRQANAAAHLNRADDVRKVVVDAIETAGYEVAAIAGDQIVVLVSDRMTRNLAAVEGQIREIQTVVEDAALKLLDHVPVAFKIRRPDAW